MKLIHYLALLVLGAVWGASFLFIGVAVKDFGPLPLMFLRVLGGGSVLLLIASLRTNPLQTLKLRQNWRFYLILGLLNSALPFSLIAFSELHISVSLAAILNATTPLFTAVIASLWGSEPLSKAKLMGVILGMIGVVILMGGVQVEHTPIYIIAVFASLLGAFFYGTGTVYAAKHIKLPAIYASVAQLLSAAIILLPFAAFTLPSQMPSSLAVAALLALMFVSTALAYLLYFFLIGQVGPTRTASVTFLIPVFGSFWGILLLKDAVTFTMGMGLLVILASVSLVTGLYQPKPVIVREV